MFGECLYWVINMSIIASFMGLIVLLIRAIRVIPRRVSIFLWMIPFLRMCIPVSLNNPYSLMTFISRFTTRTITVYQPIDNIEISKINSIMAADRYSPITYKVDLLDDILAIASWIWLAIALIIILVLAGLYVMTLREVKKTRHLRDNIYLSDSFQSPAVYGIFKPRIVLPSSYASGDNQYILRHEITHIRHLDNLWRILTLLIVSVHWFNPFSWLFLRLFFADIELACDESAIAGYNEEQRKEYATSLVNEAERKSLFASAFGGAQLGKRIVNILSYKKMTGLSLLGFSALILSIIFVLLTNAG